LRLWSLHPRHLDQKALVAVWREGLLARAVLRGATVGYKSHPQLDRFRAHPSPVSAINHYLREIATEAEVRGYNFDRSKIGPIRNRASMPVTMGQLAFEAGHLRRIIQARAPKELFRISSRTVTPHPLFSVRKGPIEAWEKGAT
jgi:hypothetical protein